MKIAATVIMLVVVAALGVLMLKGKPSEAVISNASGFPPEVRDRINQAREERDKVRRDDPAFFGAISQAMFERDPIGINFKSNTDEYEAEAGTVIPRLSACASADDVVTVLHEEFVKWFGASTAGGRDKYNELGNTIWALYLKREPNKRFDPTSETLRAPSAAQP